MVAPLVVAGAALGAAALGSTVAGGLASKKYRPKPYEINRDAYVDKRAEARDKELFDRQQTIEGRQAPTATAAQRTQVAQYGGARVGSTSIDRTEDRQWRVGQQALAAQLAAQARGEGPSLAEHTLRAGAERNLAGTMAVQAAGGGSSAMARRQATMGMAEANRGVAGDAAALRVQEQLNAQDALARLQTAARGQDIGLAERQALLGQERNIRQAELFQQAGLANMAARNELYAGNFQAQQQAELENLKAQLTTMGLNDEQARAFLAMRLAGREADREAAISAEELAVRQNLGMNEIGLRAHEGQEGRKQAFWGGLTKGLAGAGAQLALAGDERALSDPKAKSDVKDLSKESDSKRISREADNKSILRETRERFAKEAAAEEEEKKAPWKGLAGFGEGFSAEMRPRGPVLGKDLDLSWASRQRNFSNRFLQISDPRSKSEVVDLTQALRSMKKGA